MKTITANDCAPVCAERDSHAAAASSNALVVSPHERRDGFWASIRGHVLDLADPNSGHALAPTPDDLFIASIASELAWTARRILRSSGLADGVSVSANGGANADPPSVADIDLTVLVPGRAKAANAALTAAVQECLAARSLAAPVAHIFWEGANR